MRVSRVVDSGDVRVTYMESIPILPRQFTRQPCISSRPVPILVPVISVPIPFPTKAQS
jgi:hypothetical protein